MLVAIAAIIFDPAATPHPLTTSDGRAYLVLVSAIAAGAVVWRVRSGSEPSCEATRMAAEGILITAAPALFLIGRVRLLPILIVLVVAVLVAILDGRSPSGSGSGFDGAWIAVMLLVWLSLAGATALETEGRLLYPLIALIAGTAAIWLAWEPPNQFGSGALALATAIIGMELAVASSYLNISPYVEASLLLVAFAFVASCYLVVWRRTAL